MPNMSLTDHEVDACLPSWSVLVVSVDAKNRLTVVRQMLCFEFPAFSWSL